MSSNFREFINKKTSLASHDHAEIKAEYLQREMQVDRFPLEIFHPAIRPFITALNKQFDIPSSYIGLTLLSAYSSAIGTSYVATTNGKDFFYLPTWGALVGISSAGKTMVMKHGYGPHSRIQDDFDEEWAKKTLGLSNEKINQERLKTIMFRDAHIPTLIRSVLPDNPKGVVKYTDELLEWINGMNQLSRKEGIDEQFWISSWSATPYNAIRSGKQKTVIKVPFVGLLGGTQPSLLPRFFSNDRGTTGFIYRLLFALPEVDRIAEPDMLFTMTDDLTNPYHQSIQRLYFDLPVDDPYMEPRKALLDTKATKLLSAWAKEKTEMINRMQDTYEKNIQSGIFGKMKEYAIRFAAILHLSDRSLASEYGNDFYTNYKQQEIIDIGVMERALKAADYFYSSANKVNEMVQHNATAPIEVLMAATMLKMGKSLSEMAEYIFGDSTAKMKMSRTLKKWIKLYPRVFNATPK